MESLWKEYFHLTKPRIIFSNLVAAFGGFWLASRWNIRFDTLVVMLAGNALVMACSTVFNNIFDRDMDAKMKRTSARALPNKRIPLRHAVIYAVLLGLVGEAFLFSINVLSAILGLIGILVYVVVYTIWLKRRSTWSTSVGGISGSMPPVIGYVSVTGAMDPGAWLLFAVLFFWQPPHFWSLGIRRKEEYRAAGFPLLPVVKGTLRTKIQMIPYVVLMTVSSWLLYDFGYTGWIYGLVAVVAGMVFLLYCLAGFWAKDNDRWAMKTFMYSNYYLLITFLVMVLDTART